MDTDMPLQRQSFSGEHLGSNVPHGHRDVSATPISSSGEHLGSNVPHGHRHAYMPVTTDDYYITDQSADSGDTRVDIGLFQSFEAGDVQKKKKKKTVFRRRRTVSINENAAKNRRAKAESTPLRISRHVSPSLSFPYGIPERLNYMANTLYTYSPN